MSSWLKGRQDYRQLMDSVSADARNLTVQLDTIAMPRVSSLDIGRDSEPSSSSRAFTSEGRSDTESGGRKSLRVRVATPSEVPKDVHIRSEAIQTLHKISNLLMDKRAPPQVEGALIEKGLQLLDALKGCRERVQRSNVQKGSYLTLMSSLGRDVSSRSASQRRGGGGSSLLKDGGGADGAASSNPWIRVVEASYLWPHQIQALLLSQDMAGEMRMSNSVRGRIGTSTIPVPLFLEESEIASLVLDLLDDNRSLKPSPAIRSSTRKALGRLISVTGVGGGSESGSPDRGGGGGAESSVYSTNQRGGGGGGPPPPPPRGAILLSEDYNDLLKEHFMSYVRPTPSGASSDHPIHACIDRFLSHSDSLILQIVRHENLQSTDGLDDMEAALNYRGGGEGGGIAALAKWLNSSSSPSPPSSSSSSPVSRSVSPVHDDGGGLSPERRASNGGAIIKQQGPHYLPCSSGILTSNSAETMFLRDRMMFVAALCEKVLDKMFGEKQIPVYIQSMHVGASSGSGAGSPSPNRDRGQSFMSSDSKRGGANVSEGSYDDARTDVSSKASTVAFGQSRSGQPRLDITVPIVEVLPELLDGQVEMLSIHRVYEWAQDYMVHHIGSLSPLDREEERRRISKLYLARPDRVGPVGGAHGTLLSLVPTEESSTRALLDGAASKLGHHLLRLGEAIFGPKRTILFVDEFYEKFVDAFLVCYNVTELALTELPGAHEGADIIFPGLVHVVAHSQMYALICGLLRWVAVSPIASRLPSLSNSKGMEAYVLQSFAAAANAVISTITAPEAAAEW